MSTAIKQHGAPNIKQNKRFGIHHQRVLKVLRTLGDIFIASLEEIRVCVSF
jgi:hypothetical protein